MRSYPVIFVDEMRQFLVLYSQTGIGISDISMFVCRANTNSNLVWVFCAEKILPTGVEAHSRRRAEDVASTDTRVRSCGRA